VDQLLTTKLFTPPTRPELVSRPRLIERLNGGLHRKLTLISAPAGFGKTTLVTEWLVNLALDAEKENQIENRIAWISLDEGDNDFARFLAYFIAALNRVEGMDTTIGEGALTMLQSPQPPPTEAVLTPLINEIAAIPDRILLVLDDYHLIEAQPVHDALTFFLEHLPLQIHLVIAAREDPHLPLSRLRARGQLTELRAADLRFTSSEAAEFLNQEMGLDLSTEDVAALETRTEGWIAGLQLAAISLQGHADTSRLIQSFTGSNRLVLDYLIEEVLDQQTEDIQAFLIQTAILNRLTGSLCDAVRFGTAERHTKQDNGQEILEMLDRANLFIIPLDEERHWYRYHHLFTDLLRQRLRQTQPDLLPILHHNASEWYEQNGFIDEAIEHAMRAEDFERAAHMIEEQVDAVWERGEHAKLERWLAGLPVELVLTKPQLCIFLAWNQLVSGEQEAAERSLQSAEHALETSTDRALESSPIEPSQLPDSERMKIQGRAAVIRAFLAFFRGDVPEIIQYAHQALEYLPKQDLTWRSTVAIALGDAYRVQGDLVAAHRAQLEALEACKLAGDIYPIMLSNVKVAINLRMLGELQQTIESCQQQMQFIKESGLSQTGIAGWLLAVWGETLAELNDLDGAAHHAKKGIELIKHDGTLAMLTWSYTCLVRILFSRGDLDGAEEIIQITENIARKSHVPPWITNQMAAWRARVWLAQDKLEAVPQWVEERELVADGKLTHLNEIEYMMLARILIAQEQLDEATVLLQRLLEAAEAGGRTSRVIEILILQALVFYAQGDTEQALTTLEKALTLAESEGFIRIFVDEGPPMSRLLYEAVTRGIVPGYANRLLAAFPMSEPEQTDPSITQIPKSKLVEPLSEREIEVLQLIAEGLTNQEVASRLFLALSTVKVHTRNIYGKLGAHHRADAVAKARAFGILPSS
jgi:LuxR family maltose regulon positive regulatory protein